MLTLFGQHTLNHNTPYCHTGFCWRYYEGDVTIQDPGPVPLRVLIAMMTASTSYWGTLSSEGGIPANVASLFQDRKAYMIKNMASKKENNFPVSGTLHSCYYYYYCSFISLLHYSTTLPFSKIL